MRSVYWLSLIFLTALFALQCSPLLRVYSEEEPGVNLRRFRTYEWLDNASLEKDDIPVLLSAGTEHAIRAATDGQMTARGYKRCDNEPDLMLHYHVLIKDQELYFQDWWCDDEAWHKYGRCQRIRKINYQEGTLIIDMIETQNGNQVWRGVAVGVLEQIPPDAIQKRIEQAVQAIYKKFPEPAA